MLHATLGDGEPLKLKYILPGRRTQLEFGEFHWKSKERVSKAVSRQISGCALTLDVFPLRDGGPISIRV